MAIRMSEAMQNLPPGVDKELRDAILQRGGSGELARVVLAANERARDKEDEVRELSAACDRYRFALRTIINLSDLEMRDGDEARAIARSALGFG